MYVHATVYIGVPFSTLYCTVIPTHPSILAPHNTCLNGGLRLAFIENWNRCNL